MIGHLSRGSNQVAYGYDTANRLTSVTGSNLDRTEINRTGTTTTALRYYVHHGETVGCGSATATCT
ncbi:MAG: hypothetical protein IT303_09120 [Dehalococcoidia bacterium]|nr:hypothetical protein [Dehalococcoidia bacterium]